MSHWVSDAANRAKEDDDEHARREQAFAAQTGRLWGGLTHRIEDDVKIINQNQDLMTRRLGGERLRVEPIDDGFQVVKITYPALYLRVRYQGRHISVERDIVTNGQARRTRTERENISFEIDGDYNIFMKNDNGHVLTISEASEYLLTPLLNTHKIK